MKEALKLALEALEDFADVIKYDNEQDDIGSKACCGVLSYHPHSESCKAKQAITAIKAALAQPAQEPLTDDARGLLVIEHLGPNALLHKPMSIYDAFHMGIDAAEAAHGIKETTE